MHKLQGNRYGSRQVITPGNPSLPANAVYAQTDLHTEPGKPYSVNVHIKELGPDKQYGVIYAFRKQEVQQNGFGVFNSQYAQLGNLSFTDTGRYVLPLNGTQNEVITLLIGYASAQPSYLVLDDVHLNTYTAQDYLAQAFDEDIAPWRNYALEPDTTLLQPGEMAYDGTGQQLHITQGDFSIPGDGGNWMPAWAGAAAFSFATVPGKHYRLKYDYQPGTVDTLTSMAGVNILSTTELKLAGLFGARRLYEQPSQNSGTTTTGILTVNDTSMTLMFYALSPQAYNASPADFYLDNIVIEEVTEVQCSDAEIQAYTMQNGKYRYGYNGKEKLDEISSGDYDLGERIYSSRLGRPFTPDPDAYKYPWQSSYAYHRNSPISIADYLGKGDPPPVTWDAKSQKGNVPDESNHIQANIDKLGGLSDGSYYPEQYQAAYNKALDNINRGRKNGCNLAADNMQFYLNGKGGTKLESLINLNKDKAFVTADKKITDAYVKIAQGTAIAAFSDGGQGESYSYKANKGEEQYTASSNNLYFAAGTSNIKSQALIKVARDKSSGDVTISIVIYKTWMDTYDWHDDVRAIPTLGADAQFKMLENVGAKSFSLRSYFVTTINIVVPNNVPLNMPISNDYFKVNSTTNSNKNINFIDAAEPEY